MRGTGETEEAGRSDKRDGTVSVLPCSTSSLRSECRFERPIQSSGSNQRLHSSLKLDAVQELMLLAVKLPDMVERLLSKHCSKSSKRQSVSFGEIFTKRAFNEIEEDCKSKERKYS